MAGAAASAFTNIAAKFVQSKEVPITVILATSLLYGVKEFLSDVLFTCPEKHFQVYGSFFILGPSILLFCLALLASPTFWKPVAGCCLLRGHRKRLLRTKVFTRMCGALLLPPIWLIHAFVEEEYYVCARLGPLDVALAKANTTAQIKAVDKEFTQAKTTSQLIAWGLLLVVVIVATIFVTIYRSCSPIDPKLLDEDTLKEREARKAVTYFNERIKPLTEIKVREQIDGFFEEHKEKDPEELCAIMKQKVRHYYPRHARG